MPKNVVLTFINNVNTGPVSGSHQSGTSAHIAAWASTGESSRIASSKKRTSVIRPKASGRNRWRFIGSEAHCTAIVRRFE